LAAGKKKPEAKRREHRPISSHAPEPQVWKTQGSGTAKAAFTKHQNIPCAPLCLCAFVAEKTSPYKAQQGLDSRSALNHQHIHQ